MHNFTEIYVGELRAAPAFRWSGWCTSTPDGRLSGDSGRGLPNFLETGAPPTLSPCLPVAHGLGEQSRASHSLAHLSDCLPLTEPSTSPRKRGRSWKPACCWAREVGDQTGCPCLPSSPSGTSHGCPGHLQAEQLSPSLRPLEQPSSVFAGESGPPALLPPWPSGAPVSILFPTSLRKNQVQPEK